MTVPPGVEWGDVSRRRSRPRVVHLTTTDISLDLLLGPQLRAFAAAGYEVIGMSAPGPHVATLEEAGIAHVGLAHATRSVAPGRDLRALAELHGHLRRLRPSVIHTHNPKPGIYGRLAGRAAGVPVVVNTVHGLYAQPDDPRRRRALVYGLERLASTCSSAELVQNPEDLETLRRLRVPATKLHLLGNGIDLGRFAPERACPDAVAANRRLLEATGDHVVIGAVGRLVAEKGYRELILASARLRAAGRPVRVVAVGPPDPGKADALDGADLEAGAEHGVRFVGERSDMVDWYGAFDLFVLPSWREGFPRAAMEAAAMGLPVVASDIRGCRQVVDHGTTGHLVPVRRPDRLADALERLVLDPGERRRFGAAGRAKALREFDQQAQIDLTLDVYERLGAGRSEARR